MSTGSQSRTRPSSYFSTSVRIAFLTWVVVAVAAYVFYAFTERKSAELRDDISQTQSSIRELSRTVDAGNPALAEELRQLRQHSQALVERLETLESALADNVGPTIGQAENSSEAESQRAVERARLAAAAAQAKAARQRLKNLKTFQAQWGAAHASLLTGESGQRIAGSQTHLELIAGLLAEPRPGPEQVAQWERQLEELALPIEQASVDADSHIVITEEHAKQLSDLGEQLSQSVAAVERQQLLLEAVLKETSTLPMHERTLQETLRQREIEDEKRAAEEIIAARAAAREAAEKKQKERLAALERELVEAETRREEEKRREQEAQKERLAELDRQQIAEEARVKEAQRQATIAGLKEEAARAEEALRKARLEREFEQVLPEIKGYLSAFTADGFKHRADGTKGPVSYSFIKASGALAPTRQGMERLIALASVDNDRPRGALPRFIGGNNGWRLTPREPIEKAQELLNKFGELMVEKGILAP